MSIQSYQDHFILPTGGGKKGLVLGSVLAAPDGMTNALSLGQICILNII